MRFRVLASALLLFVVSAPVPHAQQFVLSSADRARLLALDFVVVDAQGQPVRDLRAEDVTLKIDGRTRAIRSLEFVPVAGAAADLHAPSITPVAPPYGSNLTTDAGRSVVLIVDRDTIRPGGEVGMKAQIAAFLRTLGPQDRVALLVAPYGGLKVDLTSDLSRINLALASITGQYTSESASDASCRTGALLVALRGTMDDLRGGEGPVAVVLFTGQMSVPAGVVSLKSQPDIGRCAVRQEYFSLLGSAAAAARAQFYIIQPDLAVDEGMRAGLEHLSGITGGPLMYLGGNDNSALSRVGRETSGYYIARVEPEPSETTGALRGLSIAVARPGTTVRHRPQLSVSRPFVRGANTTPTTPLEMMKQAQLFRDLPLRVTAYTSREPGGQRVRVVTLFDSPDPAAAMSSAMVGLFDAQGRMVSSTQLSGADLASSPVVSAMSVGAGTYRVRVAATEAGGRSGAADFTVAAELTPAGPLKMSTLVLGSERAGKFLPQVQFRDEVAARAHLEIYGGSEGTQVGVAFEIARTANGPALVTVPGVFDATSEPDRFIITAALAIGALPPGDYVVRATVAAKDQPAGRVLTTLRKVAR